MGTEQNTPLSFNQISIDTLTAEQLVSVSVMKQAGT